MLVVKVGEEMDRKTRVPCFLKDSTMRERGGAELHDRQFHSVSLLSGFGSFSLSLSLCLSEYITLRFLGTLRGKIIYGRD